MGCCSEYDPQDCHKYFWCGLYGPLEYHSELKSPLSRLISVDIFICLDCSVAIISLIQPSGLPLLFLCLNFV